MTDAPTLLDRILVLHTVTGPCYLHGKDTEEVKRPKVPKHFKQERAGRWVEPRMDCYFMKCCDCNLIHQMEFRVVKGKVQFRAWRRESNGR